MKDAMKDTMKDATKEGSMEQIYIEKWIRFVNKGNDGWDFQLWPFTSTPDTLAPGVKFYKLKVVVPAELVGGEIEAEIQSGRKR